MRMAPQFYGMAALPSRARLGANDAEEIGRTKVSRLVPGMRDTDAAGLSASLGCAAYWRC